MPQDILSSVGGTLPLLGWAIGFYFSSVLLVGISLLPAIGRIIEVIVNRRILRFGLSLLLEMLVGASRVLLVIVMLIIGGALSRDVPFSLAAWQRIGQTWGSWLEIEPLVFVTQVIAGVIFILLVSWGITWLLSEQRTAQLVERLQRPNLVPATLRACILLFLKNMVIIPIFVAYVLHVTHLI